MYIYVYIYNKGCTNWYEIKFVSVFFKKTLKARYKEGVENTSPSFHSLRKLEPLYPND
jgi:hypothetical protein